MHASTGGRILLVVVSSFECGGFIPAGCRRVVGTRADEYESALKTSVRHERARRRQGACSLLRQWVGKER